MANVKPIPEHCHSLNCYVTVKNCAEAVKWYTKAFSGKELCSMPGPDGKIMHAEVIIGDSVLMLSDECPEMGNKSAQTIGGTPFTIMLYTPNVDELFQQAIKAGAKETMPVSDMFWGDRYGKLVDPYGNQWAIATHKEDVAPEEMKKRQEQFFK